MKLKILKNTLLNSLVMLAAGGLLLLALTSVPALVFADDDAAQQLIEESACKAEDPNDCISDSTDPAIDQNCEEEGADCNLVAKYVNPLIRSIAAVAGLAIAIGIIIGGIQYASSGGDPQKAAVGKKHIKAAVIALIAFLFLYALLNFLTPGGIG